MNRYQTLLPAIIPPFLGGAVVELSTDIVERFVGLAAPLGDLPFSYNLHQALLYALEVTLFLGIPALLVRQNPMRGMVIGSILFLLSYVVVGGSVILRFDGIDLNSVEIVGCFAVNGGLTVLASLLMLKNWPKVERAVFRDA